MRSAQQKFKTLLEDSHARPEIGIYRNGTRYVEETATRSKETTIASDACSRLHHQASSSPSSSRTTVMEISWWSLMSLPCWGTVSAGRGWGFVSVVDV